MKRAIVAAGLLAASVAEAGSVTPPVAWQNDTDQGALLAAKANATTHFGGAKALATADVYVPPEPGIALFVTVVAAKIGDARDAAARVAVDELNASANRVALGGSKIVVDSWDTKVDRDTKQVVANLVWRDDAARTLTHSRMVIAGDHENLVAVTGECVSSYDAAKPAVAACDAALATLETGIVPAKRAVIGLAPTGTPVPLPDEGPALPGSAAPTMSDGSRTPMPPITVSHEQQRTTDRRPVYVGLGIVVLAALFWWNQRRRARFEPEKDSDE